MKIFFLILFSVCVCILKAQTTKQAEYFIDVDKGIGKNKKIMLPSSADSNYNFNIDLSDVSVGTHKLYVRTKDSKENWSLAAEKNIDVFKTLEPQNIVAAEYFFTTDKGFGNATEKIFATSSVNGKFKFKIPYNKIPADANTLFIRVEDSVGNWSLTKIALFNIQSLVTDNITGYEKNINNLQVFPNPAAQLLHINYKLKTKSATLKIYNINGQIVTNKLITPENLNSLDVSKFSAGAYIILIQDGDIIQSAKFIKQ